MTRIAIDTNLWLYLFLEGQDEVKAERLRFKLTGITRPVILSQVIVECVANLIRQANLPLTQIQIHVEDLLTCGDLQDRDAAVIARALSLMQSGSWSWWDSLIVAGALEAGCDELWTEDMQTWPARGPSAAPHQPIHAAIANSEKSAGRDVCRFAATTRNTLRTET